MKRNIKECNLEFNVSALIPDTPGLQVFDPRIREQMTPVNPLYIKRVSLLIDETTKYPIKTLEMIEKGQIKGNLDPLIANPNKLPVYSAFYAYKVEFSELQEENKGIRLSTLQTVILGIAVVVGVTIVTIMRSNKK